MANSIAHYTCVWPDPAQRLVELRAHEIVVGEVVQVEESLYGTIDALLHSVFICRQPNAHIVHPQGPLRAPPQEQPRPPLSDTPHHSPGIETLVDSEPVPDWSPDSSVESLNLRLISDLVGGSERMRNQSLANQSTAVDAGNNSGAVGEPPFPSPLPGSVLMTNFHTPATGRSQGRIKKGGLLKPDFLIYKANPNGCFTEGGGPDILRLVVEVKSGESLNVGDRHRLRSYFSRIRAMNAVGTGVLLIMRGDAYFWYYDELEDDLDTDLFIEITGRYSRKIDDWGFVDFLMQWERGEQGVRFDPSQDVPMP